MYNFKPKTLLQFLLAGSLIAASACSSVNNEVESLSEEDLEIASQIIAESISDENSGVMSNVYDALSDVNSGGISYGNTDVAFKSSPEGRPDHRHRRSGRGQERDYEYSYDPETGIHSISFTRSVIGEGFSKEVVTHNQYIYTDPDGSFIEFPEEQKDSVETIYFIGNKSGEAIGRTRSSEFTRIDTLEFAGLFETSEILTMAGTHYGAGNTTVETDRVSGSRSYKLSISFNDIQIDKAVVEANGNLEEGVTGTVQYSMIINRTSSNQDPEEKVVEGELVFEGDGTALLRFKKLTKVLRVYLDDGEIEEDNS